MVEIENKKVLFYGRFPTDLPRRLAELSGALQFGRKRLLEL
ncbi:hypothetical protein SAMN00790413_01492 [Deinococcus hopiensis KR-140]|uniref:Uncharacterized protein n=1 Tax=Deinococcus hopiensis KR-140 TaxID=695939 RepID=A0A1W1VFS0_9DEIO|nr:hypothetical protein SAMN00790413_01492 [Deinococcus hopiensis KR-140]